MDGTIVETGATRRAGIPAVLTLLLAAVLVTLLLAWSTNRTDDLSFERQRRLISHVIQQSVTKVALEQEGFGLKDNSVMIFLVPEARDPATFLGRIDEAERRRIDGNWGRFLHTYYRHDESYVLDGANRPLFAMRDGERARQETFEQIRTVAEPVVAEARARMRGYPAGTLSRGGKLTSSDIAVVNGHPAIVSVTPIVSPTGIVAQARGKEVMHVSILRLDARYLQNLSQNYRLEGARFAWANDRRPHEASLPFVSPRTKRVVGYFLWTPFTPGSIVMRDIIPVLVLTLLLIGAVIYFLLRRIHRSTAQLIASEAQAKHLAFHDVLTGLPNRALFNDRLDRALATARRHPDRKMALLCLDLDRFKQVNDTLGHSAGDELIRELARRLNKVVRETDTVARLGGDEFAVILTDVTSDEDITALCGRILSVVQPAFEIMGSKAFVGMSIGVARSGIDGFDRTELARKGDIALYRAKSSGRGRFEIFTEEMDSAIQDRQTIEHDLRRALEEGDQLKVFYQTKYDATSKSVVGIEALVRWQHPTKGQMWPLTFVPIAEQSGLIEPIGEWVLREACLASLHWPLATISVNISPVQLRNPFFAQRVLKILAEAGMDPHRLELEITETAFLDHVDQCDVNLKMLRLAGVRIALDDFGTGYSSLAHLRSFRVDRLKIDRSFTAAIENMEGSAIIEAIVSLARSSGLQITAEGVETKEQSEFLCSIGCDELQGYLMSIPVPMEEIDAFFGVDPKVRRNAGQNAPAARKRTPRAGAAAPR